MVAAIKVKAREIRCHRLELKVTIHHLLSSFQENLTTMVNSKSSLPTFCDIMCDIIAVNCYQSGFC